jgi:hypothetical protein
MIRDRERAGGELLHLEIPHSESRLMARLHEIAEIQEQTSNDDGVLVTAWVPKDAVHLFKAHAVRRSRTAVA